MKLVTWLLEPLADQEMARVHKELGKLRSGTNAQWAIAEVTERLLATTELVICVDARRDGGRSGDQG